MLVEEPMSSETYQKLLQYIFQECTQVSFTKYHDQHQMENNKTIQKITNITEYSEKELIKNYSDHFISLLYNRLKDNENIFDITYQNDYEKKEVDETNEQWLIRKEINRKSTIKSSIEWLVYNEKIANWIEMHKKELTYQNILQVNTSPFNNTIQLINYMTVYFFRLTTKMQNEIKSKLSLYDWNYPNNIEDISFFRNDYCFLYSIAHENICFIFCHDEKEFEYLKSIGIKFVENQFKVETSEEWHYTKFRDWLLNN